MGEQYEKNYWSYCCKAICSTYLKLELHCGLLYCIRIVNIILIFKLNGFSTITYNTVLYCMPVSVC